jgi:hypothetical protein
MWLALLPILARALRELGPFWPESRRHVMGVTVTFAVLVTVPIYVIDKIHHIDYELPHYRRKAMVLWSIGLSPALLGAAAIALIFTASERAIRRAGAQVDADEVQNYLRLRTLLQRMLIVEAAILGGSILTNGTLRHAVNQIHRHAFPKEELIAFGAWLSFVEALLYGPTHWRLRDLGSCLCKRLVPLEGRGTELTKSLDDRKNLETLLGLHVTAGAGFQNALVILAPLVISLILGVIGGK